jgi:phenylpropionate dioxygenase-like ring-hydroxylating dioxygenase large terminal subunit
MLSKEDNELLCRIGPGTAMGNLMREYWIPAVRSDELPVPDGAPMRVRLLGEDLIAFRTTSGGVGIIQNACPHRGASMFFGRNEEDGLRCVYHGWKFDVTGACVDMPSEPAESNFKNKVRTKAYPVFERGGIIWAYMGERETPPSPPDLEANMLEDGEWGMYLYMMDCNWMQGWEGEMDTIHAAFLHFGATRVEDTEPGTFAYYQSKHRDGVFAVLDTEWGTSYGMRRPAEDDTYYWRIAHQLFPFYAMVPTGILGLEVRFRAYVPIDDDHVMVWTVNKLKPDSARPAAVKGAPLLGPAELGYLPNTTDWLGRWRLSANLTNDFLIDRDLQKSGESYSGIKGIRQQDAAVTGSMGPIYQRDQEHLGTTDALVIRTRRRLIAAARALRDEGILPPGVDQPAIYAQRSGGVILPRSADWWESTQDLRRAFVDRPELAPLAPLGNT